MSKTKLKVEVKTGAQGQKIAEVKPQVKIAPAVSKPKGKPIYKPKAKINTHIKIGRKR